MMSDFSASEVEYAPQRDRSANPLPLSPTPQPPAERPWLSRAGYFRRGNELAKLALPLCAAQSSSTPENNLLGPPNPVYFSRTFISKIFGGTSQSSYANVRFDRRHIYHIAEYYVGIPEWTPQFPKVLGEHGALLFVGTSLQTPEVRWISGGGGKPRRDMDCFVKRSSAKYEYIGRYVFHPEYRILTQGEVERHITKATWDLWMKSIDKRGWGTILKNKVEGVDSDVGDGNGNAHFRSSPTKTANELFKHGSKHGKLCFYWQYVECIGYDPVLYDTLCTKGKEIGWTTRESTAPQEQTKTEEAKEESSIKLERIETDQPTTYMSSEDELDLHQGELKVKIEPENSDQRVTKESPPEKKARV